MLVRVIWSIASWRVRVESSSCQRAGTRAVRSFVLVLALLLLPCPARAVDTLEPFGRGASDFELYVGSEELGVAETPLWSTLQLGYGLSRRLSAYLNGTVWADAFLRSRDKAMTLGLYGSLFDTRYFDLDLLTELRLSGSTLSRASIAPGVELNLDVGSSGLFLMAWGVLSGRQPNAPLRAGSSRPATGALTFDTELCLGAYWTVGDGQQLMIAFESTLHHTPESGEAPLETGAVALGYNVVIHEGIELINEVSFPMVRADPTPALGVSTGLLVSF